MNSTQHFDVLIIGGGLAGLTAAIHLSKKKCKVLVIEKQSYPHHKVCGEYVSNEVLPYLQKLGVDPFASKATRITNFKITSASGVSIKTPIGLGGFGLSRYALDKALYDEAKKTAAFLFDTVTTIRFENENTVTETRFSISTQSAKTITANYVLGAFGKRSTLDKFFNRKFIANKTPWMAVKAHYEYQMPTDLVALHNFKGGYCGLSKTETGAVNACYLAKIDEFKKYKNIETFQQEHLAKNSHLKHFFANAQPLFKKPLTISQISFDKKEALLHHIFMVGDSAGLIHPLCGNGMAMAIHSAKLFSELYLLKEQHNKDRTWLELQYIEAWKNVFESRINTGSYVQRVLLSETAARIGVKVASLFPAIIPLIIKRTHGKPLV